VLRSTFAIRRSVYGLACRPERSTDVRDLCWRLGSERGSVRALRASGEMTEFEAQGVCQGGDGEEGWRGDSACFDFAQCLDRNTGLRGDVDHAAAGSGLAQERAEALSACSFLSGEHRPDHGAILIPG